MAGMIAFRGLLSLRPALLLNGVVRQRKVSLDDVAGRDMKSQQILVVGAGPTGLALALWLTRLGVAVRVIDRAAGPGTTSRALAVQARTLEGYRQLGIADAVVAQGTQVDVLNLWANGRPVAQVPFGELGRGLSPYPFVLFYPQDAHERFLIDELDRRGVVVGRQTELVRLTLSADGVRAWLRHADGTTEETEADYVCGCDGVGSAVRTEIGVKYEGNTQPGLFFVADVELAAPLAPGQPHGDLEDADMALAFPLPGGRHARFVGNVHESSVPDRRALTFDDVQSKAVAGLRLNVAKVNWFSTYRVQHRVAERFRVGRVFLLGDAAHVHSPVGGQGMNTGIGDAVNLAWKLGAVVAGEAGEGLLDTYERERIGFARLLVATTDRAFTLITKKGWFARFVRTKVVPRIAPLLFARAWVRRLMFRTVSQTRIHYRRSSLSRGAAGGVRGGDRLPWVATADGSDNHAPLASLSWQVHVYGTPPEAVAAACDELGLSWHVFEWRAEMKRCGFRPGAVYLIRPDGYVAFADARPDWVRLRRYLSEVRAGAGMSRPARRAGCLIG
jgi:2-polyprenyl-6-methoxyphenol hydroxylase-like FAD-dependent oxidoreductase